jgi:hypothetical protein
MQLVQIVKRVAHRSEWIVLARPRGVIVRPNAFRLRLLPQRHQRAALFAILMHAHEMTRPLFAHPGGQPRPATGSADAVALEPQTHVSPVVHLLEHGFHEPDVLWPHLLSLAAEAPDSYGFFSAQVSPDRTGGDRGRQDA